MTKSAYIGINDTARKVKSIYIGVDGIARKVTKGYIGVSGIAQQWHTLESIKIVMGLSVGRSNLSGASNKNYAFFAGGLSRVNGSAGNTAVVDAFDRNLVRTVAAPLAAIAQLPLAASTEKFAVFVRSGSLEIEAYDKDLTKVTGGALSIPRATSASMTGNENHILVAGGSGNSSTTASDVIDVYTTDLLRNSSATMSVKRYGMQSESSDKKHIIAGGYAFAGTTATLTAVIDFFDENMIRTSAMLTTPRTDVTCGKTNDHFLCIGGVMGYSPWYSQTIECFHKETLVRTIINMPNPIQAIRATSAGSSCIAMGGINWEMQSDNYTNIAYGINSDLSLSLIDPAITKRYQHAATAVNNIALFGGGMTAGGADSISSIEGYDSSFNHLFEE